MSNIRDKFEESIRSHTMPYYLGNNIFSVDGIVYASVACEEIHKKEMALAVKNAIIFSWKNSGFGEDYSDEHYEKCYAAFLEEYNEYLTQ